MYLRIQAPIPQPLGVLVTMFAADFLSLREFTSVKSHLPKALCHSLGAVYIH